MRGIHELSVPPSCRSAPNNELRTPKYGLNAMTSHPLGPERFHVIAFEGYHKWWGPGRSSVCRRHLPYFYEGSRMSAPVRYTTTSTTETRLELLASSVCTNIGSLHVCTHAESPVSLTLWTIAIPALRTPLPSANSRRPFPT